MYNIDPNGSFHSTIINNGNILVCVSITCDNKYKLPITNNEGTKEKHLIPKYPRLYESTLSQQNTKHEIISQIDTRYKVILLLHESTSITKIFLIH